MKLYINGVPARVGQSVFTFRNEQAVLLAWFNPGTRTGGSGGRVCIRDADGNEGYYFPGVINAKFMED